MDEVTEQDDTPAKFIADLRRYREVHSNTNTEMLAARAEALFAKERERSMKFMHHDAEQYQILREELGSKLSRLQAVAARYKHFGYNVAASHPTFACMGCTAKKGEPHADGCPVGRYEADAHPIP